MTESTPLATTACVAPDAALYLRPDGVVMTCCGGWHVLGHVSGPRRRSLREIWEGEERAALVEALAAGRYDLGCFGCKVDLDASLGASVLARSFDRYAGPPRSSPAMIDFALSDRCNLQCVQCSGTFSSSIRRHREGREPLAPAYDDRFFDELDGFLPYLERAQFKGGEPFLIRGHWRVWDRLVEIGRSLEVCITTNGTVWNDRVERVVSELRADLIVSVDAADPDALAAIRVGVDPEAFWRNVERFRSLTRDAGRSVTLSFCLMSINWRELIGFLETCDRLGTLPDIEWVGGPGRFALLSMERHDLGHVLEHFESQAVRARSLEPPTRACWDHAVARVRQRVESLRVGGDGVAVAGPTVSFERQVEAAASSLAGDGDGEILRLGFVDELLAQVDVPPWASWLEPERLVGTGMRELLSTLATVGGGTMRSDVTQLPGGAHRIRLSFDRPEGQRELEGVTVPHPSEDGRIWLIVADRTGAAPSQR